MKNTSERLIFAAAACVVVLVALLVAVQTMTERERDEAIAQMRARAHTPTAPREPISPVEAEDPRPSSPKTPKPAYSREMTQADFKDLFSAVAARDNTDDLLHELTRTIGKTPLPELTEEDMAQADKVVGSVPGMLARARELSLREQPTYEADLSQGYATELPHLAPLRKLSILLAAEALVQARKEDFDAAVEDILSGMRLADTLASEPIIISQLTRFAIAMNMMKATAGAFGHGDLSQAQTQLLVEHLSQADHRDACADAIVMEGEFALSVIEEMGTRDAGPLSSDLSMTGLLVEKLYTSPLGAPMRNNDASTYASMVSRLSEAARLPFHENRHVFEAEEERLAHLPKTCLVTSAVSPSHTRLNHAQASHEARLDMACIALWLHQYRASRGEYPESLDAIAPDFGGELPVDPFSGEGYRYSRQEDGFLLYSLGPNQADVGGTPGKGLDGDLVWGQE